MTSQVDPKEFWENKILTWENDRYAAVQSSSSVLEGMANRASNSIRFRLDVSRRLLSPLVAGKRIVELGCGSGFLAFDLMEAGALSYQGYDISENAIQNAREKLNAQEKFQSMRFDVAEVSDLAPFDADIIVSLGLLDWLTDAEQGHVFALGQGADYFHTISEKRPGLMQWLHQAYVYVSYGHKAGAYVPRYQTAGEIAEIARTNGAPGEMTVFRHRNLSFGAIVTNLPIPDLGRP